MYDHVLITGGAGFVGSHLALGMRRAWPAARVTALDSLKRRGSELNLPRLAAAGVGFAHGDIRCPEDLAFADARFDLVVDCSAEPSVLAGYGGDPAYVVRTNLDGTVHCLDLARRHGADVVFLSTSRVYPIARLEGLRYTEGATRFELAAEQDTPGASGEGVSEDFPLGGHRSLYGATKLASELLLEEYRHLYGLRTLVNRCGVITGPWQMGKVDQGVFTLWLLAHHFGRPLRYIGYEGTGKQVRDLLHVDDLVDLVLRQLADLDRHDGVTYNVGGGRASSLSLVETTALCRTITGRSVPIEPEPAPRPGDVPVYITDARRVAQATGWAPRRAPRETLEESYQWIVDHEAALRGLGW